MNLQNNTHLCLSETAFRLCNNLLKFIECQDGFNKIVPNWYELEYVSLFEEYVLNYIDMI